MVHLKVVNSGIEINPHVVIAETGERVSGIHAVNYSNTAGTLGDLTIVIVAGMFEIDVDLFEQWRSSAKEDASDANP